MARRLLTLCASHGETMSPRLAFLALLVACPAPEDFKEEETGVLDDTGTRDDEEGDVDWYGGCDYTSTAIGAEDLVEAYGVTPTELAALLSGTRNTTFHWDMEGTDTTLDHTLTLDAGTALLWSGVWVEGHDTGWYGSDTGRDSDVDDDGGGSAGGDDGDEASGGGSADTDTGATTDPDTGGGRPDTGRDDTGRIDTGVVTDTGGGDWTECPDYVSMDAAWTFTTGDGALAETMSVTLRLVSAETARIDHEIAYADLAGSYVPSDFDPAEWDEVALEFSANVSATSDVGEVAIFASRTMGDMGEAMMGDIGRWPADGSGTDEEE